MARVSQPAPPRVHPLVGDVRHPRWHDGAMRTRGRRCRPPRALPCSSLVRPLDLADGPASRPVDVIHRDARRPSRPRTSPRPPRTRTPVRSGSRSSATSTSRVRSPPRLRDPAERWPRCPTASPSPTSRSRTWRPRSAPAGSPRPGKRFTFSAGPEAFAALAAAGIDVATMANNHALDYGRARLPSTFRAIRRAARARDPARGRRHRPRRRRGLRAGGPRRPRHPRRDARRVRRRPGPDGRPDAPTGRPPTTGPASPTPSTRPDSSRRYAAPAGRADVVVVYLHWGIQGAALPEPRPALAGRGPGRCRGRHRRRLARPPATGRRPARQRLRGLRARQLRVVLPRRRRHVAHRCPQPHRPPRAASPPAAPRRTRRVAAAAHRCRRAGGPADAAGRRRLPGRPRVAPCVLGAPSLSGQRGASHSSRSRPVRSSWAGDTTDGTSLASW